jgi:hypothetical protein
MIEAYAGDDPQAYPHINGPAAHTDSRIAIYPETRGIVLPPQAAPSAPQQQPITFQ